jgi:hypothetical protein
MILAIIIYRLINSDLEVLPFSFSASTSTPPDSVPSTPRQDRPSVRHSFNRDLVLAEKKTSFLVTAVALSLFYMTLKQRMWALI